MSTTPNKEFPLIGWRRTFHEVIYEADTMAGKVFDVGLIVCILLSVLAVILESMVSLGKTHRDLLVFIEWAFTLLFTAEYILRLFCVARPSRYVFSFFGIVDLMAILPTYLSMLFPGTQVLIVIRIMRLLRIFRVFKLARHISASSILLQALRASRIKIMVFLYAVLMLVVVIGAIMYVVEKGNSGFTSIPASVYWAIVTLTTVGYGDVVPQTLLGQFIAAIVMVMGYGIIAVPTGIVTAEMAFTSRSEISTQACPVCSKEGHDKDAMC